MDDTQEAPAVVAPPSEPPAEAEEPKDIESRIAYLEAQNEGLKRVGALALVLVFILGGLFVYQVWNDLKGLATGGIVLHDDNKNGRVALTVSPQGSLAVVPINQLGGAPPLEQAQGDYSGIGIYDSIGRLRIILGVTPDDQPIVGVFGSDGKIQWGPVLPRAAAPVPGKTPGPGTPRVSPTPGQSGTPALSATPSASASPSASFSPSASPKPSGTP